MAEREIGPLRLSVVTNSEEFRQKNEQTIATVTRGEQAFKQFFQQQRTGDRIQRETATGLILLSQGFIGAGGNATVFTGAINTAVNTMQAAEFASFGLQRSFGSLGTTIAGLLGPITAVVAIGAGLVSMIRSANAEAEALDKRAEAARKRGLTDTQRREEIFKKIKELEAQITVEEGRQERITSITGGRGLLDLIMQGGDWITGRANDLKRLRTELAELKAELGPFVPGEDKSQEAIDEARRETEGKEKKAREEKVQDDIEADRGRLARMREQQAAFVEQETIDANLAVQREKELNQLKIGNITDETQQSIAAIEEKYRLEEERIRKLFEDAEELEEALGELRKAKARDIAVIHKVTVSDYNKGLREGLTNARSIASDLRTILGEAGDGFLGQMLDVLSVVEAMVSLISMIQFLSGAPTKSLFAGIFGHSSVGGQAIIPRGTNSSIIPGGGGVIQVHINDSEFARALRFVQRADQKRRLD